MHFSLARFTVWGTFHRARRYTIWQKRPEKKISDETIPLKFSHFFSPSLLRKDRQTRGKMAKTTSKPKNESSPPRQIKQRENSLQVKYLSTIQINILLSLKTS